MRLRYSSIGYSVLQPKKKWLLKWQQKRPVIKPVFSFCPNGVLKGGKRFLGEPRCEFCVWIIPLREPFRTLIIAQFRISYNEKKATLPKGKQDGLSEYWKLFKSTCILPHIGRFRNTLFKGLNSQKDWIIVSQPDTYLTLPRAKAQGILASPSTVIVTPFGSFPTMSTSL